MSADTLKAAWNIRRQRSVAANNCEEIAVRPRLFVPRRYWDDPDDRLRVNPCPPNSIDWKYLSPPSTGSIVVYGFDRRDTIFILDCSLSMTEPIDPKNKQGESRFQVAKSLLPIH